MISSHRLTSYGGYLNYTMVYVQGPAGYTVTAPDVVLIGAELTLYHFSQTVPSASQMVTVLTEITERSFVLPTGLPATRENLMVVLKDLRALYIRGSYADPTQEARLSYVSLDIATKDFDPNSDAVSFSGFFCPSFFQISSSLVNY